MRPPWLLGFHSHQDYFYSRSILLVVAAENICANCMQGQKVLNTQEDGTAIGRLGRQTQLSVYLFLGKQQIIQYHQGFMALNVCHFQFITFPKCPCSYFCFQPFPVPQLPALPVLVHSTDEQLHVCHWVLLPNNSSSNFHPQKQNLGRFSH